MVYRFIGVYKWCASDFCSKIGECNVHFSDTHIHLSLKVIYILRDLDKLVIIHLMTLHVVIFRAPSVTIYRKEGFKVTT